MSRQQERIARAAQKKMAVLGQHVSELVGHTLEVSEYGGHGHTEGRQGRAGHAMPRSDAHRQANSYVPQNTYGGFGFDDPAEDDYGNVDKAG
jgi:hypothetical protein